MPYQKLANRFSKLSQDLDSSLSEQGSMLDAENMRVITRDNTSFVLTNLSGMAEEFALPSGFTALRGASYNNVCYLLLHNLTTGEGEIGSYPSPDYSLTEGSLEKVYKPLQNFRLTPSSPLSRLRTVLFNFHLESLVTDMELQPDYDGTLNIIWTDKRNPPRMVNTRFSVLPENRFRIIDRTGTKDSNIYTPASFSSTIPLITTTLLLPRVEFVGVEEGGSQKGGNYRYFFRYATADGNRSDVVAESRLVSVFFGNKASDIRGAIANEVTSKRTVFRLTSLDSSYASIKVSFIYDTGESERTAYEIDSPYPISGGEVSFSHQGSENVTRIDVDELSLRFSPIDTVGTLCQVDSYLALGNVKEKQVNTDGLSDYALSLIPAASTIDMPIIGTGDLSELSVQTIDQRAPTSSGTYNLGYLNPQNIYHYLGYQGGEAAAFALRYIMEDGTLSRAYPTFGYDNRLNNVSAANSVLTHSGGDLSVDKAYLDALKENQGGMETEFIGANTLGVFRFPNRSSQDSPPLLKEQGESKVVSVNGISFFIPEQKPAGTVGCIFLRSDKKKDSKAQGYLVPTIKVPTEPSNSHLSEYYTTGDPSDTQSLFIPLIKGLGEGHEWRRSSGQGFTNYGISPFVVNKSYITERSQSRLAFLSPDIFLDKPAAALAYNNSSLSLDYLYKVIGDFALDSRCANPTDNGAGIEGDYKSLFQTKTLSPLVMLAALRKANADFIEDASGLASPNRFGASTERIIRRNSSDIWETKMYARWNSYLGLKLENPMESNLLEELASFHEGPNDCANYDPIFFSTNFPFSYLVNLYGPNGQRSLTELKNLYSATDSDAYYAISDRLLWSDIEAKLDSDRRITLFGGDTYIGTSYRRLFLHKQIKDEAQAESRAHIGYSVSLVTESSFNQALRSDEIVDTTELAIHPTGRTFMPLAAVNSSAGDKWGEGNRWRDIRLLESSFYNKGYLKMQGGEITFSLSQSVPFSGGAHHFQRVYISSKHVPNAFENGYRQFSGLNYKDYPSKFGELIKLVPGPSRLLLIFEYGVGIVGINERLQTSEDLAGKIFVENFDVLSPYMGEVSTLYGSKHPLSVVPTDNEVYFADSSQGQLLKTEGFYSQGKPAINIVSKFKTSSQLKKRLSFYQGKKEKLGDTLIQAHYDREYNEVLFSFYNKGGENFKGIENFTLCYQEDAKEFTSYYSFLPLRYLPLGSKTLSMDVKGDEVKRRKVFVHNADSVDRLSFYGEGAKSRVVFIVKAEEEIPLIFHNLELLSNNVFPRQIRFYVQGASSSMECRYDKLLLHLSNTAYRDEKVQLAIPTVKTLTHQDITGYLPSDKDNAQSSLFAGARMRGRHLAVELIYDTVKQLRLKEVHTLITPSYS